MTDLRQAAQQALEALIDSVEAEQRLLAVMR